VCFEKRLVVAHELGGDGGGKAQAYGELGTLHSQLGNYEQALSCLEHQLNIAHTAGVRITITIDNCCSSIDWITLDQGVWPMTNY